MACACALTTLSVEAQTSPSKLSFASPAEQKIASAQTAVAKNPAYVEYHNELAAAFTRRALETDDPRYYLQAERALENSFRLAPENFNGEKIRVRILIGRHEYAAALSLARDLNTRIADDISVYGFIADAAIELGNYKEAEQAVQWMLDLRHAGAAGFIRIAHLRELYGDIGGGIEALDSAYESTSPDEVEEQARLLTQSARLALRSGQVELAERQLQRALRVFPGYHLALFHLAAVRTAQASHADAVELLMRADKTPQNLYALANALNAAKRQIESQTAFAQFEASARAAIENPGNANLELIFFYINHTQKPAEALRIAGIEIARRQDVRTLDAYAWALHANGKHREARAQLEKALAVGIRDADFYYHYASILSKLGDTPAAAHYYRQSLDTNPFSSSAAKSREALARRTPHGKPRPK